MKLKYVATIVLSLAATRLFADFQEPFTDSKVGRTITAGGCLISDPGEKSGYSVLVLTDAGHKFVPAELSTNLHVNVQSVLGRRTQITATIRADRSLLISDFAGATIETNQVSQNFPVVNVETSAATLLDVIKNRPDCVKAVYLTIKVSSVELKNGIILYAKSTALQREMSDNAMRANVGAYWE